MEAAADVLRSGWVGQGPRVAEFEAAFAAYVGARHCVAVSSGTAALHLALRILDPKPASEVITTPLTYLATHYAIDYVGCRPVLADIESATGNVDASEIEQRITPRTAAILVVHYGGYPCDLAAIYALAEDHGVPVVEDCAHATGAAYRGARIGSGSGCHCFSFGPPKNLTAIHGGAITTNDSSIVDRLRALRAMGVSRTAYQRASERASFYRPEYPVTEEGFRYEMSDVNAAIATVQLTRLDAENARRAEIADAYRAGLSGVAGIRTLEYASDRRSSYHMYPVLAERRDALAAKLGDAGIDVGTHYPLNPLVDNDGVPHAEEFAARTLTLPLHPSLNDAEVRSVIDVVAAGW